ncbi:MAG: aldolase/citrate lyase family protein [Sphaerochaetaceae bacterium]|nr:aldolase/citrate lyase family protein [Sphaerochaetaceae bacterium]
MTQETFSQRLRGDDALFGTLVISEAAFWPAMIASCGVDFVFIDMEHIPLERPQVAAMCQLYKGVNLPSLVRIPSPQPFLARKMLDAGAAGIIAPYIETLSQVEGLIGAVKKRPLQGQALKRAQSEDFYQSDQIRTYVESNNAAHSLILNIESMAAVENLERIISYDEVDAILIGPHDLSCSLGIPEQYEHPRFIETVTHIIETARKSGKGAGYHKGYPGSGIEFEKNLIHAGMNLVIHEADILVVQHHLADEIAFLKGCGDSERARKMKSY